MKEKLKDLLDECKNIINKIINQEIESFEIKDLIKNNRVNTEKIKHIEKGIYFFYNEENKIVYIGQGGVNNKTQLKKRVLQELRNYTKTINGNNGATLSKNIQSFDKIVFDTDIKFREHIKDWKIKILNFEDLNLHMDIIESLCIELYQPIYNIKGK